MDPPDTYMLTLWVERGVGGPSSAGSSLWGWHLPALWHPLPLVLARLPAMPDLGEALGLERSCVDISQGTPGLHQLGRGSVNTWPLAVRGGPGKEAARGAGWFFRHLTVCRGGRLDPRLVF